MSTVNPSINTMPLYLLAWQQLRANWRAGDLRVLLIALVLAVAAITSVNAFSQRIAMHLNSQGGILLGGDLVVMSDHVIPQDYALQAKQLGLATTQTAEFPSMVVHQANSQIAEIKALGASFPLRGDFSVQLATNTSARLVAHPPPAGDVWLESRIMGVLSLKLGDRIHLGEQSFKVSGVLEREPSRGGDMFSFAPRAMMNAQDLAATKLIQYGSRVKYQLIVAGDAAQLNTFSGWLKPRLQRGERVEDVKTARPEIKSALDKAEVFLGLSAMVSVMLAIVAMLLASGPYLNRQLDTFAMLRCFGATTRMIQTILLWQTVWVALLGGVLGCALGYALQQGLATLAGRLFLESLAPSSMWPFVLGMVVSLFVMLTLMWPHLRAIRTLPTVHILRREVEVNLKQDWFNYLPMALVVVLLMVWQAKTLQMALIVSGGLVLTCVIVAVLAYAAVHLLFKLRPRQGQLATSIHIGLTNLRRRLRLSIAQMIAFSLGLMVIVLLSIVKTDLMQSWQDSLPADAPNRFVINLQPDQLPAFNTMFAQQHQVTPQVHAMVRARLVAINHQKVNADSYQDERAKRLASREFNLSWAAQMQADNRLISGRWWTDEDAGKPYISLEQDLAQSLNIHLGDTLTYDVAGTALTLKVTSIRKVEWDSMRANFFAVTPPKTIAHLPASYMTAFHLPPSQTAFVQQLVSHFPNLTVIDVAALMEQVRAIMQKMSVAVSYVFLFSLVTGLAVLYAALIATQQARIRESTLLRVLGASRRQVSVAMLAEFFAIALCAVVVAVLLANGVAWYVSIWLLEIPYHFNMTMSAIAIVSALILIPAAAWLALRSYLNHSPKQLLNSI
ncbi:putative ABC-type transport system involved in lysophospholipase L1 biosynthesis, permease component [Methylophilaceae bacterium 11]|nr:putative ABC-type transport system involved in lysophospholipase L1 biosynthesis, permease component [Methylophilaceae bacterium 11]